MHDNTIIGHGRHANSIINDPIGKLRPQALTPTIIKEWLDRHRWAPKTARNKVHTLQVLAKHAGVTLALPTLPALDPNRRRPILNIAQDAAAILSLPMPHHTRMALGILITTGIRPQELRALRAEHLMDGAVDIQASLVENLKGGQDYKDPKTKKSFRLVKLSDPYALEHWPKEGWVVAKDSRPLTASQLAYYIEQALKGTKWAKLTPMSFRRSVATAFANSNIPPKNAADNLGHSVAMMLDIYAQTRQEAQDAAIDEIMGDIFGDTSKTENGT